MKQSLLIFFTIFLSVAQANERPNIIVFYTDDHGYADLGIQGVLNDIKTPHIDALAKSGVLARNGYSTAPQCVPSRGGLLVGKFQGRFNLDSNASALDGFNKETTIATRLQKAGYMTAQFGKWHLGPEPDITSHGFKHVFSQSGQRPFFANITLEGKDKPMGALPPELYHIDGCSRAAASLIERYKNDPFFLYIAYRAPHTPLDAPPSYTARFPGKMPERRRQALAMLSAVDDGVGLIAETLQTHDLTGRTLIVFIGDNGAPLKIHKIDSPLHGDAGGWDGSLNIPLNGEKGMLSEGGMHVPFVISWPGTIPGGQLLEHPVSSLDVAATAVALAGIKTNPGDFDGVNLKPHLTGVLQTPPHDALYWRWTAQSAIREGHWKLLRGGEREYLYDLGNDPKEKHNLASREPEIAARLRAKLTAWSGELTPPGLALGPMADTWNEYFDHYLEGKIVVRSGGETSRAAAIQGWEGRHGVLRVKDGFLVLKPDVDAIGGAPAFLTNTDVHLPGPVTAKVRFRAAVAGQGTFSWRTSEEKDFLPVNSATFDWVGSDKVQEIKAELAVKGRLIHIRLTPRNDSGDLKIESIELQGREGKSQIWNFTKEQ